MTPSVTVRPGFGKLPDIPKTLSAKSASGGKNVTATQSNLKSAATQTISTSTLSNEWRSKASTNSSNFVPGQRPIEFVRDRTVTVPHGAFADAGGKYQLESDMGMTKRSTERLLKQQAELQKQQQMAMLNRMNMMYGNGVQQPQMSFGQFAGELMTMLSGLFSMSASEKGGAAKAAKTVKQAPASDTTIAAMQNATTASDLSTAIEAAKGKVSEIGTKLTTLKGELSNLKGQTSGLQTAKDEATKALADNKTSISQKQGEVQNNIQRESASQMAMNAAQTQVDMLKSQLATAGPLAKAGIEASLAQAEQQLELKTKQYEEAVKAREQSEKDLKALQDQTPTLENNEKTAKAKLEDNKNQIASKESDVTNYGMLEKDMNLEIGKQEERLATLQKEDESNKKA